MPRDNIMHNILDLYAQTNTPYIHALGRRGAAFLVHELAGASGGNILEIGFGTGQTLVDISAKWPLCTLYGVEISESMLTAARKRMKFCGLQSIHLLRISPQHPLPFRDNFFDAVYAESALAYLPGERLDVLMADIYRVLKKDAVFMCNESLWRTHISQHTMLEINEKCLRLFGIPQANVQYPHAGNWVSLCAGTGFRLEKIQYLQELNTTIRNPQNLASHLSRLFTCAGRLKRRIHPALSRRYKAFQEAEREFEQYGLFLEGIFFKFRK